MDAVTISEGRRRLFDLRQQVVDNHDQVIMTHKAGNIVLISMNEWEIYRETTRLMNDREALMALVRSFEQHDAGKVRGKSVDKIFSDRL